jgi:hypothetical protein
MRCPKDMTAEDMMQWQAWRSEGGTAVAVASLLGKQEVEYVSSCEWGNPMWQ